MIHSQRLHQCLYGRVDSDAGAGIEGSTPGGVYIVRDSSSIFINVETFLASAGYRIIE